MNARVTALRVALAENNCDAFISFSPPANEYLAGFRGSTSAVIVTPDDAIFVFDFRYRELAQETVKLFQLEECNTGLEKCVALRLEQLGVRRVAFDSTVLTVEQHVILASHAQSLDWLPLPRIVSNLRQVKDAGEIARIQAANDLAEGVLADLLPTLREGTVEREFAAQMEFEFKRRGASGPSFSPIVLFGPRTSLPHGVPGDNTLKPGDVVLLDFGCILDGYCSDLTRTFVFANIPGAWFSDIYEVTLRAQLAALEAIRPGARCADVDAVARDIITEAGYGDFFGHGLGHGVGLEIHEAPRLNRIAEAVLAEGNIVTVEPGIYLPGKGGVRIEDIVAVTSDGCRILSRTPKELKVLQA
jgi:Xaa-Pro aminopeptidase